MIVSQRIIDILREAEVYSKRIRAEREAAAANQAAQSVQRQDTIQEPKP